MSNGRVLAIFGLCAAALLGVMAWLTSTISDLDRAQRQARQQAALEESVRLALWRMESLLGPLIARQNAAPHSFYGKALAAESSVVPASPYVRLHFQWDGRNRLTTSPRSAHVEVNIGMLERRTSQATLLARLKMDWTQIEPAHEAVIQQARAERNTAPVQTGAAPAPWPPAVTPEPVLDRERAQQETEARVSADARPQTIEMRNEQNDSMRQTALNRQEFMARHQFALSNVVPIVEKQRRPTPKKQQESRPARSSSPEVGGGTPVSSRTPELTPEPERVQQTGTPAVENEPPGTDARNDSRQQATLPRPESMARDLFTVPHGAALIQERSPEPKKKAASLLSRAASPEVRIGMMEPLWMDDILVLARRVRIGKDELVQGCWLDWPRLDAWLLGSVRDLLPEARLHPVRDGETDPARRLAALPVRLEPGRVAAPLAAAPSTLRLPLGVAWASAIVSLLAVGTLLVGIASLGERRAAFVSAVTHELRTPLTTFRMYAEMLADGMVKDETQRHDYLATLQREAERQSHLVENVLAYARLERGRYGAVREETTVSALLGVTIDTLRRHARRCGMTLTESVPPECGAARVSVDASAVERILFNLVDNACKHAGHAEDRRIQLDAGVSRGVVTLTVSDHGPGLGLKEARRLFRPFRKSAREAANSSPGVGLGLALSRRLARAMGGDLHLARSDSGGASFSLRLRRVQE
ncbi:MAG: hypothetical protein JXO72_12740 [Vicinamibacteria bacterium]|nr:hypothetical protein [Vicinamibacteria bacterium]